ncbi:MAG: hypothetical protein KDD43_07935 [Bdellovibrionales bacterium]|nr:hypothetical protein [Bdellovibrionales bacterium]
MYPIQVVSFLLIGVLVTGCGSSSGWNSDPLNSAQSLSLKGTCDHRTNANASDRQCREWRGDFFSTADLSVSCAAIEGGAYSDQPCPLQNHIGTCILNEGKATETRFLYYDSDWNLTSAEAHCADKDLASKGLGSTTSIWRHPLD